ncbi:MAG TPA: hypothetical protein VFZ96_04500 [Actinomycetota bacterium]|nr:hypothetical protein [Actinomycetota bacterium]
MAAKKRGRDNDLGRWMFIADLLEKVSEYDEAETEFNAARVRRDRAIQRAKAFGLPLSEIAKVAGVTRERVQQLAPHSELDEEGEPGEFGSDMHESELPAEAILEAGELEALEGRPLAGSSGMRAPAPNTEV